MQKVIQRAERAHRVAAKKAARLATHRSNGEGWERGEATKRLTAAAARNIVAARQNRREDWELGALAPRRDVGKEAASYGAVEMWDFYIPDVDPKKRLKWYPIRAGDRAVVVKGRDRGRISVVQSIDEEKCGVTLKTLNMVDIKVPEYLRKERQEFDQNPIQSAPRTMPIENVRLVYPLPDPETGVPRDVIIERLEPSRGGVDRIIPGTKTIIPWPEVVDEQLDDHPEDTLRITVEEQTFRPWLLHPPMPLSVINELRNPYSKFRTRHDFDYLERKELEDARTEKRKALSKGMRTPLQELSEVRRKQKEVERSKELTEEQLKKIGEVIIKEKEKALGVVRAMPAAEQ
ncbi:ribosomal protein YmL40, mitochondrial [Teratosphaeria destructans]|uniref:Ribosomal protein YmL40, mitochondrial n=1 Tax=Teratosphaeria destructans TaxID=418781 RepID=A0A9W7SIC0_9PEZI|nr:ribosomal protein YmL40, mitochondrial [Teratosphaeria destructans]